MYSEKFRPVSNVAVLPYRTEMNLILLLQGEDYSKCVHLSDESPDERLTLETSAFKISVRWPIYIINSVDKANAFIQTLLDSYKEHALTLDQF